MPFKYTFCVDPVGMTVPYAAIADEIRHNHGFEDLRGRPDMVGAIPEGKASPALQRLLMCFASAGSMIFTLGCELGSHQDPAHVPARKRQVAGGYVQLANGNYYRARTESYAALARAIIAHVKGCAKTDHWELNLVGQMVDFKFPGEPTGLHPSVLIWFFARARDQISAWDSRERLIEAIESAVTLPATLEAFAGDTSEDARSPR
jgi:hypothetical protein